MTTPAIDATGSTSGASTLTLQDFLQVLTTQLTYQDPLKPLDNQQFMAQIAQFTTLEQTQQMTANLQSLAANQAAQQSVGLLGQHVYLVGSADTSPSQVTEVSLSGGTPTFTVTNGTTSTPGVTLSQIARVVN